MGWRQLLAERCTVCAIMLLVLVATSHRWIVIESISQTYPSGIWKICPEMVCPSILAKKVFFEIIRLLLVLSLFCGFFCSSFMLSTSHTIPSYKLSRFLVAAIGCFVIGFLMGSAMTIYTVFIAMQGISRAARVTFQPIFYLGWCTVPIFVASGFLCLMAHYYMPRHRISLTDEDSLNGSSRTELRILSMDSCHHETIIDNVAF